MKLNQIIAIEKGVKAKAKADLTEVYRLCDKPELFTGFNKTYEKINDQSEDLPAEQKRVQFRVDDLLRSTARVVAEMIDTQAAIDWANASASADLVVDGNVIAASVPVTHLMFLEHQFVDLRTFISKLPELDEMDSWTRDDGSGLFKSGELKTHRTKKMIRPIVKYEATKEHPAQTEMISEDVLVGYWAQVKQSGGIEKSRKATLMDRIEALIKAVKFAREEANSIEASKRGIGGDVFAYLLS